MNGYMGKILRVNLTTRTISTLDTKNYEEWGGGHGIGSAIFWELCKDKAIDAFDPGNVVTVMTSPISGTLVPSAAGRCEVQGIGATGYPVNWFTRSNFGGRFSSMLKWAGWDGVVIEGKASSPVWIKIVNDKVTIEDAEADGLWGRDTWDTQKKIRAIQNYDGNWKNIGSGRDAGRTTQAPAILTIGPAGENMSRTGSLVHDGGAGAGEGGFGGVWGSKNLKAISVLGTGSVEIADPAGLLEARLWAKENYGFDLNKLQQPVGMYTFGDKPSGAQGHPAGTPSRPNACIGCHRACHGGIAADGLGNGSHCFDGWYDSYDAAAHGGSTEVSARSAEMMQRLGINAWELAMMMLWLPKLYEEGFIGPGKQVHTDLPFDKIGEMVFSEELQRRVAYGEEIGADLIHGCARAAIKWGRYEQDLKTGDLPIQVWGYPHHYDARTEAEWGYGTLLGERDINEHDFTWPCYWVASIGSLTGAPPVSAEEMATIIGEKLVPYCDPKIVDYSDEAIYSESMVKMTSWHRHYTRYWKQSIQYCDWGFADFLNPYGPGWKGMTPEAEPKFLEVVTGQNISFEEGMKIGARIWNLDRAIWILQGRHRDMEVYSQYVYEVPAGKVQTYEIPYMLPAFENGEWIYKNTWGRVLDREKVEDFKTLYFEFEGWDPKSGWPKRSTLERLNLGFVADELAKHNKLGA